MRSAAASPASSNGVTVTALTTPTDIRETLTAYGWLSYAILVRRAPKVITFFHYCHDTDISQVVNRNFGDEPFASSRVLRMLLFGIQIRNYETIKRLS
jgi:hypothetical protein